MKAIVAGPDEAGITAALENEGVDVTRLEGHVTRPHLEEAGVVDAELYVLTDVREATTIPIVRDLTDSIRTVVYDQNTVPEFVRGQLDLAIDPALLSPAVVANELTANGSF